MKILVLEQSRVQQIILSALFKECGLAPDFVETVAEAKAAVDKDEYDFVFTGYSLPDGNGIELGLYIRNMGRSRPGIVLLTTEDKRSIIKEALSAGITRILFRSSRHELHTFIRELADTDIELEVRDGKVLLVDDDRTMSQVIKAILEEAGYSCIVENSAERAMSRFNDLDVDLVISDYYLLDSLTGLDIVTMIRQMGGKKARVPIVVISGQANVETRVEILRCGANDYVAKPIVPEELQARITNLITQKRLFDRVENQRIELQQLAMTDSLTGLYNRHYLSDVAPKRIAEAKRHKANLALMVIDIDHFKTVNDSYGHDTGDDVLREFATLLKKSCRQEDIAIRLGGEEFLLILPHCSQPGALEKAEKLRNEVVQLKPAGIEITASFGVTCADGDSFESVANKGSRNLDFGIIFSAADSAVYQAKNSGRNCVKFQDIANFEN
ncbi:MAG: diguanylate cyclase [Gammaproteobacteria bacterium]|nr:diguanylate cyclase [Gammaproteobacteria bacterium]